MAILEHIGNSTPTQVYIAQGGGPLSIRCSGMAGVILRVEILHQKNMKIL